MVTEEHRQPILYNHHPLEKALAKINSADKYPVTWPIKLEPKKLKKVRMILFHE